MYLQPVGCDLQLGSDLKIDLCGVCGGDGSSCSDSIYQWQYGGGIGGRLLSPCSASCDGGKWPCGLFLTYNVALETSGHVNYGRNVSLLSQHSGHLMKIQYYIGPLGFTINGSPGPFWSCSRSVPFPSVDRKFDRSIVFEWLPMIKCDMKYRRGRNATHLSECHYWNWGGRYLVRWCHSASRQVGEMQSTAVSTQVSMPYQ